MERYDYRDAMLEDIRAYIEEHYTTEELKEEMECRRRFEEKLYDDMFISDSVTGNASGSYTFNAWAAEENLCHNQDLLQEAMAEFGCEPSSYQGAEWGDVTIRCYLLGECLSEVLDEIEDELPEDEEEETE